MNMSRNSAKTEAVNLPLSEVWEKGGEGGVELAEKVIHTLERKESNFHVLYPDEMSLKDKAKSIQLPLKSTEQTEFPMHQQQRKR